MARIRWVHIEDGGECASPFPRRLLHFPSIHGLSSRLEMIQDVPGFFVFKVLKSLLEGSVVLVHLLAVTEKVSEDEPGGVGNQYPQQI